MSATVQPGNVFGGFCANTANIWQIAGYILLVFKIVIPILLIVWGMLDLGRAVVAAKDDEIKKATKSLAFRALAGVLIFFIPTIVSVIIGMVSNFSDSGAQADYNVCRTCLTNPYDGECDSYSQDAWNGRTA